MKLFIYIAFALLISTTFAALNCYATGDPHYRTFDNFKFDIYGQQGNFYVAQYKDILDVQADMFYHKRVWSTRALQFDVGVKVGNTVIQSNGGLDQTNIKKSLKINGKVQKTPFAKKTFEGHVQVYAKAIGRHMQVVVTSTKYAGLKVIIDIVPSHGIVYHNLYVHIPNAWKPQVKGFCNQKYNRKNPLPLNLVGMSKVPKSLSLINSNFKPENLVANRVGPIEWKSKAFEIAAFKECGEKYGLGGGNLKDCLTDVKVAGDLKGAQGYSDMKADMKELMKQGKKNGRGHLHAIYVLVVKMRNTVKDEIKNSKSVLKGLNKEVTRLEGDHKNAVLMATIMAKLSGSTKKKDLEDAVKALTGNVKGQLTDMKTKVTEEKQVLADAEKELGFIRKVLEFVGEQIQNRK